MTTPQLPEAPTFGLWYDFRNPAQWRVPAGELYRQTIDQAVWAERLGFGSIWLSEHHFADDDYASSPLMMAAALGARTSSMRIGTNIIVAGLHNPIRLAEDATALSLMTGNRFELGVGLGYRELEFSGFGRTVKHRPSLLDDAIAIIRRAWSGSADGYEGKRLSLPAVPVTPVPESRRDSWSAPSHPWASTAPRGLETVSSRCRTTTARCISTPSNAMGATFPRAVSMPASGRSSPKIPNACGPRSARTCSTR